MPQLQLQASRRARWSYPALAAASLVIVASVAAATPVATWIMHRLSPPSAEPVPAPPAAPSVRVPDAAGGMVTSFRPTDSVLIIRVAQRQVNGSVHLIAATSDRISAQSSVADAAELIVLPGELQIANAAGSAAEYRIAVPSGVRTIRLFVAGREAATVSYADSLDRRLSLR
jgi:hypothetical protein